MSRFLTRFDNRLARPEEELPAAAAAAYYQYDPLSTDEIRVVKIKKAGPEIFLVLEHKALLEAGVDQTRVNHRHAALSYCWGDATDMCDITIRDSRNEPRRGLARRWENGVVPYEKEKFSITRSLWNALKILCERQEEDEELMGGDTLWWIDQICIDQSNVEERNEQVQNMWRIYSSAVRVYAWIGGGEEDEEEDEKENDEGEHAVKPGKIQQRDMQIETFWRIHSPARHAYRREKVAKDPGFFAGPQIAKDSDDEDKTGRHLDAMEERIANYYGHSQPKYQGMLAGALRRSGWDSYAGCFHITQDLVKDVMTLIDQPYFSRTWIVPEILQAQNLTFLHGRCHCPAQELKVALDLMFRSGWKYDVAKLVAISHLLQMREQTDVPGAFTPMITDRSAFLSALQLLHDTDCADMRDKVFAALSTPILTGRKDAPALRPDYLLSRDELVVMALVYFDKLQGSLPSTRELSRTLSRSLKLWALNDSGAYQAAVATSILSCTRPWSEGESLFLKSGTEIGQPGYYLKTYLSRSHQVATTST